MADDIKVNLRYNPPALMQEISNLPSNVRGPAVLAASFYLVGDESHGLRHYVQYRYVTRAAAYGQTFSSDRQRRYVMAAIRRGEITPGVEHRTGATRAGWGVNPSGVKTTIVNSERGAFYTVGDPGQSRHEAMVGWRRLGLIVASNEKGMIAEAERVAQAIIREKGLATFRY